MRLSDLKPYWSTVWEKFTPEKGGEGDTGLKDLFFVCPYCTRPHEIRVRVGPSVISHDKPFGPAWAANPAKSNGPDWIDALTLTPSIDYSHYTNRKGERCSFHKHIIDGSIV